MLTGGEAKSAPNEAGAMLHRPHAMSDIKSPVAVDSCRLSALCQHRIDRHLGAALN